MRELRTLGSVRGAGGNLGPYRVAALGGAIATAAGELADEAVTTQLGDEAAGGSAATAGFGMVAGWLGVEVLGEIAVGEADDGVLAGEDGAEDSQVASGEGREGGVTAMAVHAGVAEAVQLADSGAMSGRGSERVKVALVGGASRLVEGAQIGDPFAHWSELAAADQVAAPAGAGDVFGGAPGPQSGGIVDGGLHAQAGALVVGL